MSVPGSLVAWPFITSKTLRIIQSHHKQHTNTHTHAYTRKQHNLLPAQHPQNEIENEKGAEDDERDKIDPRQLIAHSILHLRESKEREQRETERRGGLTREDRQGRWKGERDTNDGGERRNQKTGMRRGF